MLKFVPLLALVLAVLVVAGPAKAQDAEAGEALFKKCKACHQIGADAENRTGPILSGIVGRVAGTVEGFKYRKDIITAGEKGLVWNEEHLLNYLADPTEFLRSYLDDSKARSAMTFKIKDEEERTNLIAFLKTSSSEEATDAPKPEAPVETRTADEVIADQTFSEEYLANPANFVAGKEIWFAQCTHCHGYKAYPGKAPKLKPAKYTPEFVFKRVYKGFKKMPGWEGTYTVDEIRQIVAYVKSKSFSP